MKVKFYNTLFAMREGQKKGPLQKFKFALFLKGVDLETAFILVTAAKAYVMAGRANEAVYWKFEAGGGMIKRTLKRVNLTPLTKLDAVAVAEIEVFKSHPFFGRIKGWLTEGPAEEPRRKYVFYPDWIEVYRGNDFYRRIIEWMEAHDMLEYEDVREPAPPVISPPVPPPPPPAPAKPLQKDLFGWKPPAKKLP